MMMPENLKNMNPPKKGSRLVTKPLEGRTHKIHYCLSRFRHFHWLKNNVGFEATGNTHICGRKYATCCFLSPIFWISKLQAGKLILHAETPQKSWDSALISKHQRNFRLEGCVTHGVPNSRKLAPRAVGIISNVTYQDWEILAHANIKAVIWLSSIVEAQEGQPGQSLTMCYNSSLLHLCVFTCTHGYLNITICVKTKRAAATDFTLAK